MSKLLNFLQSLLPAFDKSRILDNLDDLENTLQTNTLPPLKTIAETVGDRQFKNAWAKGFNTAFLDKVKLKGRVRGNSYVVMNQIMQTVESNIPKLRQMVEKQFADDVLRDNMSIVRANLIQYIEVIDFAITMTNRLLILTMDLEESEVTKKPLDIPPAEYKWLESRLTNYYAAMTILAGNTAELEDRFKKMPDMVINESNASNVNAVVSPLETDPYNFGFIGVKYNPIYHVRIAIAEYQVQKYYLAKEQKTALELKLMRMKQLDDGTLDAKLQQQIEYTQMRIEKLSYEIKKMEEDTNA